jgi:hypothetical protein
MGIGQNIPFFVHDDPRATAFCNPLCVPKKLRYFTSCAGAYADNRRQHLGRDGLCSVDPVIGIYGDVVDRLSDIVYTVIDRGKPAAETGSCGIAPLVRSPTVFFEKLFSFFGGACTPAV